MQYIGTAFIKNNIIKRTYILRTIFPKEYKCGRGNFIYEILLQIVYINKLYINRLYSLYQNIKYTYEHITGGTI